MKDRPWGAPARSGSRRCLAARNIRRCLRLRHITSVNPLSRGEEKRNKGKSIGTTRKGKKPIMKLLLSKVEESIKIMKGLVVARDVAWCFLSVSFELLRK